MSVLTDQEVLTPPCLIAFPSLFKMTAFKGRGASPGTGRATYNAVIVIPPEATETIEQIKTAMRSIARETWGDKLPKLVDRANPLHPCTGQYEGFTLGSHFLRVQSGFQPVVVDQHLKPILNEKQAEIDLAGAIAAAEKRIYYGCWCRFYIKAFVWANDFGKGFGFNLNAVQLVKEGPRLGGARPVDDIFDPIAVEGQAISPAADSGRGIDDLFA